ncbi:MAG: DUF2344 domain-containing protein [Anaerolineales bacterium]|nr:DUF2344 domain-containing protein [Anaerolineales bacterium]
MIRIRITFSKTEAMRYTGHLDLHRTWERTIRRAGLPLAYSQGFHPQPRLNLAAALPLGFTSACELLDVWLEADISTNQINQALNSSLPPGLQIHQILSVDPHLPALQTQVQSAEYLATLLDSPDNLSNLLDVFWLSSSILRVRRGKEYDLRPLVESLQRLPDDENGYPRLQMRLAARHSATGRPEEVLDALGLSPHNARVHRTALLLS